MAHAAGGDTIRVALVGCGGRGTGAAANALATTGGPIKLVAMADVFENRLQGSFEQLKKQFADKSRRARRTASSSASTATRRRWIV